MQRSTLLLLFTLVFVTHSCSPKYTRFEHVYQEQAVPAGAPDYSNLFYWAAHPDKHDPSDSIPEPLLKSTRKNNAVDVFFIHPTTFTSREDTGWNAALTDAAINAKTDYSTILYQASAFNEYRVFAPRYRQAHFRSYFTDDPKARQAFDLAYEDVKNAFLYYMEHENHGRPVIIASHSQGSTHALRLLKAFFDNDTAKNNLVAAYIPGMYIPADYFSHLQPCNDEKQTGCFVGWRTYKRDYEPVFVEKEKGSCLITNPLTWKTDTSHASYSLNKGAVTTKFNRVLKGVADAQIHDGILWINRPRIAGSVFLKMKNFHVGDINLFYMNIRENLRERVAAFGELKP